MTEFVGRSGDEMAFFKGRQWIPRGVRYPTTEEAKPETDEGGKEEKINVVKIRLIYKPSGVRTFRRSGGG